MKSLLFAAFVSLLLGTSAFAAAAPVNKALAGKILFSDKRFYPTQAKSPDAFNSAVKSQSKTVLWEDKATKRWRVFCAAFYKAPTTKKELVIGIYDAANDKTPVTKIDKLADEVGQTSSLLDLTLDPKILPKNKEYLVKVEEGASVLAVGRVKLLGAGEKFNGKVDFTEE